VSCPHQFIYILHSSASCCMCFMFFGESGGTGSDGDMTWAPGNGARRWWGGVAADVAHGALGAGDQGATRQGARAGRIEVDGADCACESSRPKHEHSGGAGVHVQGEAN
jgi:hypothetical protein